MGSVAAAIVIFFAVKFIIWRVERYRLIKYLETIFKNESSPDPTEGMPLLERTNRSTGLTGLKFLNDSPENSAIDHEKVVNKNQCKLMNEIGSGNFGTVHRGRLINVTWHLFGCFGTPFRTIMPQVAIKISENEGTLKSLQDEYRILLRIPEHINILRLVGISGIPKRSSGKLYLLTEYCENGNLLEYIRSKSIAVRAQRYTALDSIHITDELLCICLQVAAGLFHLSQVPILHRDLSLRNILLTKDKVVKIADFGLSKNASLYITQHWFPPWEWLDIHALRTGEFTIFSDIWSFGIVLWELWSFGKQPYEEWNITDRLDALTCLESGDRLDVTMLSNCPDEIAEMMQACWNEPVEQRPDFRGCYNRLCKKIL